MSYANSLHNIHSLHFQSISPGSENTHTTAEEVSSGDSDSYPNHDDEDVIIVPTPSHQHLIVERVKIFSRSSSHLHRKVFAMTLVNIIVMCTLILGIIGVFWASTLNRLQKAHHLDIWILDFDQAPDSNTSAFVGPSLTKYANSLPYNPYNLDFQVHDVSTYHGDMSTVIGDVVNEVAWGIITIAPNASATLLENLRNPSPDFSPQYLVSFYYPEARFDPVYDGTIIPFTRIFNEDWTALFRQQWWPIVNQTLPSLSGFNDVYAVNNQIISNPIDITFQNVRPVFGTVYYAILTVGLIFLVIVSFFQVHFFVPVHMIFLGKASRFEYMIYRPLINYFSLLFLSLAFSFVSLAFQVDFTHRFGHAGFFIYWMVNYFSMLALGGASENIATIIINTVPHAAGFWLLFWVCMNGSTALAPLALAPAAYRIGKVLPVHNTQQAIRTILFSTKNELPKNFAVLIIWVVVNYIMSWPCFEFIRWYKRRQARQLQIEANEMEREQEENHRHEREEQLHRQLQQLQLQQLQQESTSTKSEHESKE